MESFKRETEMRYTYRLVVQLQSFAVLVVLAERQNVFTRLAGEG